MSREDVKERFMEAVKDHSMEVLLDQGLHKHLRFSANGSSVYHFNMTTWPGYLCISGDMGCYVFSRTADMFEFFRTDKGRINPQYWSGKCVGKESDPQAFCPESFEKALREYIENCWRLDEMVEEVEADEEGEPSTWSWTEYQEPLKYDWQREHRPKPEQHGPFASEEEALADLQAEVWEEVENAIPFHDGEHFAYVAANEFKSDLTGNEFEDFWEYDCREYTFHFLWVCHAIVWGIQQYDALTAPPIAA